MKKIIFTFITFCFLYLGTNAQFCGTSDSLICTADTTLKSAGFNPVTDSLAPFVNGMMYSTTIQLKNYDSIPGEGSTPLTSLKIDSINNLPAGLCWATNKANNTLGQSENGCIVLSGTVCDTPGQYTLDIAVTVNGFLPANLAQLTPPVYYWIRVRNAGDTVTPVDSSKTAPFTHLGTEVATGCTTGINEIEASLSSLSIMPNPIISSASAIFISTKSGPVTERITNIIGAEVHNMQRQVKPGSNTFAIERNNMPPGVYFYTLSDGKSLVTKRMLVTE